MESLSDRELLELAAKAAGVVGADDGAYSDLGILIPSPRNTPANSRYRVWNPLGSDGDALRLAVKLGIFDSPKFHHFRALERFGHQDKDDTWATRRAIVRAAAAIGAAMQ